MLFVVVSVLLGLVYSEAPVILTHPTNITVSPGASAEFYCKGEGSPTPTVMFTPEHYLSEVIDRPRAQRRGEGVVSTRKNFLAVSEADEGWYVCIAANSEGIATSRAYLRVKDLCKKMKCSKKETCVVNNELGTASCQCTACEDTKYSPVCGSDCKSYFNSCSMKQESCELGRTIHEMSQGQCPLVIPLTLSVGPVYRTVERQQSLTLSCEVEGSPAPTAVRWYKQNKKGVYRPISYESEIVIQHARKSTAGDYKCVAKHCDNKIESEIVTVEVESNFSDDPAPVLPTCRIFGDPHITTFDGLSFDYQGACDYVVSMDCENMSWILMAQFLECGEGVTCIESLTLYYHWASAPLQITRGWIIGQGGEKMRVPLREDVMIGELKIRYTGLNLKVTLPNGVRISWDGLWGVEVQAPVGLKTCGLCGDNDGNKDNDIEAYRSKPSGAITPTTFAESWKMDSEKWCAKPVDLVPTIERCGEERYEAATLRCSDVLDNKVFSKCLAFLGRLFYESACVVDVCLTQIPRFSMDTECAVANTLVQHCENAGFRIDQNWNKEVGCPKKKKLIQEIYDSGCPLIGDPPFINTRK